MESERAPAEPSSERPAAASLSAARTVGDLPTTVRSGRLSPANVLAVQRTAGNAAVTRLLQRETATEEERQAAQKKWERSGEARRLISKYEFAGIPAWLRTTALGKELVGRLPGAGARSRSR